MDDKKLETDEKLKLYYFRVTDLWQRLCEKHNSLFDATCDEYYLLLNNDVDKLEEKIEDKKQIIAEINALEKIRADLISEIAQMSDATKIESVNDLLLFMKKVENELGSNHLERFNLFLVDIITKIQDQNKRNKLFINKALRSLKEIRMSIMGDPQYSTYNSKGGTRMSTFK